MNPPRPTPQPESPSEPKPTTLASIKALPKKATFATIKTVFHAIPQKNRIPRHMEQAFNALNEKLAVLLLQNLFPNEQHNITTHSTPTFTPAYSMLRQRFSILQVDVDSFFALLESTQETIFPTPPSPKKSKKSQEPENPPPGTRLAKALAWLKQFGS